MTRTLGALALCAVLAAACGGSAPPPTAATAPGGLIEVLRLRYRRSIVGPLDRAFRPTERSTPEIDVHGRRVFVGTSDKSLYCLRADDGSTLWRFETHAPVETEPFYDRREDALYFASGDGAVYALRGRDGTELWHHDIRLLAQRRPAVTDDALYYAAGGTSVFAIDRARGERLWAYRRESPEGFAVEGQAGPALAGRRVYAGFSDGVVVALSAIDGALEWERDTSVDVEEEEGAGAPSIDVDTTPIVHGELVYVGSVGGGVYALNVSGGGVAWRREDLRGVTGLANRGATIYAAVTGKGLLALDGATGQTIWRATLPGGGLSQPVLARGYAYVTSHRDGLFVVRLQDGLVVQTVEPGRGVFGAPVIVGRRLFFLSNSAVLYALEVAG